MVAAEYGNISDFEQDIEDCPKANGFYKTNYYSNFKCTNTHPTSVNKDYAVFEIINLPPHYRREVRMEVFHLRESSVKLAFKMDSNSPFEFTFNKDGDERFQISCKDKDDYLGASDYYYDLNYYTTNIPSSSRAKTLFSLIDKTSSSDNSYLRIRAIQFNVLECHNSCQACSNSTSCDLCDSTCSTKVNGSFCKINNSSYFLQEGKCVSDCTAPHFKINGECKWIPDCQVVTSNRCSQCKTGFQVVQTDNYETQCQITCPNDYQIVSGSGCVDKKISFFGTYLLQGFYSTTFSSYELERTKIVYTNFMNVVTDQTSKYTRCQAYQLLGGYFSNQKNSLIASEKYTTTFKYVRISFRWVLIDYDSTSTPNSITVSIVGSTTTAQKIDLTATTKVQLCGLSQPEYVGNFLYDFLVPSTGNVVLNILNSMDNKIISGGNNISDLNRHQYFGIRELSVFAFNCQQSNCDQCNSPLPAACTKCQKGYYLSGSVCTPCLPECLECSNGTQCTLCNGGRVLNAQNKCVCPSKYYLNSSTNQCIACQNTSCETCNVSDSTICLTCLNLYLQSNNCSATCLDGSYKNTVTFTCDGCITSCQRCVDGVNCTLCNAGTYLQPDGKSCQTQCPVGYRTNGIPNWKCEACETNCEKCQQQKDICTKCGNSTNLQGSKCQNTCDLSFFPEINVCLLCTSRFLSCQECTASSCSKCAVNFFLHLGNCVSACPTGYFQDSSGIPKCNQCANILCATCEPTQSLKCITCGPSHYKQGDTCVLACNFDMFANSQRVCTLCSSKFVGCQSCTIDQCQTCIVSGEYLDIIINSCGSSCPAGRYKNVISSQNVCSACNTNCKTCVDTDTKCTSCASNSYLQTNTCQPACNPAFYPNTDRLCLACTTKFANCGKCTATACTECSNSTDFLVETSNTCVPNCPSGSASITTGVKKCKPCLDPLCKYCSEGDQYYCTVCYMNSATPYLSNGDCVSSCSSNQYETTTPVNVTPSNSQTTKECKSCSSLFTGCQSCIISTCQSCIDLNQYLDITNNSCGGSCIAPLIQIEVPFKKCVQDCASLSLSNCIMCESKSGINVCNECGDNYKLDDNKCLSACPANKYSDSQNICQTCESLFPNCNECTLTGCSSCSLLTPYFDPIAKQCSDKCEYGAIPNSSSINCQTCTNPSCKSCNQIHLETCETCDQTANTPLMQDGTCVSTCDNSYYQDQVDINICKKCFRKFDFCDTCDFYECDNCQADYYLALDKLKCYSTCPDGQYQTTINGVEMCQTCQNSRCQTCDTLDSQLCLTCDPLSSLKYLQDGQCNLQCNDQSYPGTLDVCKLCNLTFPDCEQCTSSACLVCKTGLNLDVQLNQCLSICPPGKYASPDNKCEYCDQRTECLECDKLTPSVCLTCDRAYFKMSGLCVQVCPQKFYGDGISGECQSCNDLASDCQQCTKLGCYECQEGDLYLDKNTKQCSNTCPEGYFQHIDTITGRKICEPCSNSLCKTCSADGSCQSCYDANVEKYLNGSLCVQTCPKYYDDITKACVSSCGVQQVPDPVTLICSICNDRIYKDKCYASCPNGSIEDVSDIHKCIECSGVYNNCVECNPSNNCTECQSSYYLSSAGQCLTDCIAGEFKDLILKKCVTSCTQSGYYSDTNTNTCMQCNTSSCMTCIDQEDKCLSCQTGKFFHSTLNKCFSTCPASTYPDPIVNECLPCSQSSCLSCENATKCTKCSNYLNSDNFICYDTCISFGKLNYQNQCVDACPPQTFFDATTETCYNCPESCLQCSASTDCTLCKSNHISDPNTKAPQVCNFCISGYVMLDSGCSKCSTNCLTCENYEDECKTCLSTMNLDINKKCITCLSNQYFNSKLGTCADCESNCLKCKESNNMIDQSLCLQCDESLQFYEISGHCIHCIKNDIQYFDVSSKKCIKIEKGGPTPKLVISNEISRNNGSILLSAQITFDMQVIVVNKEWIHNLDKQKPEDYEITFKIINQLNKQNSNFNSNNQLEAKVEQETVIQLQIRIDQSSKQSYKQLIFNFVNPNHVIDKKQFSLKQIELIGDLPDYSEYSYPKVSAVTQSIQAIAAASQIMLMIASPFYLLVSFFDLLQLTNYLLYLNVNYPSTLYNVIKIFDFANFEIIPNIKNDHSQSPFKFRMERVDTFIYSNLVQSVTIWLFSFIMYFISKMIARKWSASTNIVVEGCKHYHTYYFYQVIVGLGFLTYCDLLLSVFLQLYDRSEINLSQVIGVGSSLILLIGITFLNILTYKSTQISLNQLIESKQIKSVYGFLYNGLELNKKKAVMNIIFLFRKTVVIHQLVFNQDNPINQAYICCFAVGIETTIMLLLKPYRSASEYKIHLTGRILMISSMVLIILLAIDDAILNLNRDLKNFIQIIVSIQLIVIFVTQLSYLMMNVYQSIKRRYQLKNSVKLV